MKFGNVFEVQLKNHQKGYFQYIMLDFTQLNSEVVRVFTRKYKSDEQPDLASVVQGEIQFHAHVILRIGTKLNIWKKVGNVALEDDLANPCFRGSYDYGNPEVKVSKNWFVWCANGPFRDIGELTGEYIHYDLGPVLAAPEIPEIMMTGKSSYFYPAYE